MTEDEKFDSNLRFRINKFIIENGFAPNVDALVQELQQCNKKDIEEALLRLSTNRGIVLHPNSFKIWAAHPFALFPTLFWVKSGDRGWWGNCAWCSLGIASMLKKDSSIFTKIGAHEKPINFTISKDKLSNRKLVVHYPIPAKHWWDNVIFTCANILVFKSEKEIDVWCKMHNVKKGAVMSIEKTWELAKAWYGDYLNPNWRKKTLEEAEMIFNMLDIKGPHWEL